MTISGRAARLCLIAVVSAAGAQAHAAATGCEALAKLRLGNPAVVIERAKAQAAGPAPSAPGAPPSATVLPAHCRVDGVIESRTGQDGKRYGIRFALALPLPAQWNGRFLYQGGGGLNGSVNPPVGAAAAGEQPALTRGFAVLSTDSGHAGAVFDGSFFADQQAALNFLYQSIGKAAPVAKQLVAVYYGRPAAHSYFVGCSTGGREAMIASQRYPEVFDGIIAGAPAMRTNYSNLATRWITTSLNAAAPKDAQGQWITSQALSTGDRKLFIGALLAACDAKDGVKDGMIFDVKHCAFDPAVLTCSGEKTDSCLSAVQVAAIKQGFGGPHTRAGLQVYPGYAYDTGIAAEGRGIPGLLSGGTAPEGPRPLSTQMDVESEAAAANDGRSMAGDTNAWTNLSGFTAHGGKLIFYHGVSDPWFSALDTVGYYERLAADNARAPLAEWSRLFLVPGMGHCGGGEATLDRFDLLGPLVDWVERGQAPAQVIATGASFPGRSRPLCAYPKHAQYRGQGDTESAANFSCSD
jgi:feruloyl esterase